MLKGVKKGDFIILDMPIYSTEEWIDTRSGVRYIHITQTSFTPRLNADGTPMIITPEEMEGIDVKVK
jgi:hypothetical protein